MTVNTERITTLDEIITGIPDEYHRLRSLACDPKKGYEKLDGDQIDQDLADSFPLQYRKSSLDETVIVAFTKPEDGEDGSSVPSHMRMKVEDTDGDEVEVDIIAVRKTTVLDSQIDFRATSAQYLGKDGKWYEADV